MELQWNQSACSYLRRDLWETQNLEQSQELRLQDGMPDIGRVICAWGQPVLRSKEWRKDGVAITCGVNAWVLYAPEDGAAPRCMEVWLPFQAKWNLPDSQREGVIRLHSCLRSVDARTLSARKMMVRASLGLQVEALEQAQQMLYQPGELPEEVQVLQQTYPAMLPTEAGEKQFALEEALSLPGGVPEKILYCQIYPVVTEQIVMGSRGVFKGNCKIRLLYLTQEGEVRPWMGSYPFAQYGDLDREYDKDAQLSVVMAVTSLETDLGEEGVHIKCGLVGQYVVQDRRLLQLGQDAYSPFQPVTPMMEEVMLPLVLDQVEESMTLEAGIPQEASQTLDVTLLPDQPLQFREGEQIICQLGCLCQTLYRDEEGNLRCSTEHKAQEWRIPLAEQGSAMVRLVAIEPRSQEEMTVTMEATAIANGPLPMLTGLQLGEKIMPDPGRPSLILCRAGEKSLWELAKENGSTVERIRKANGLTGEPEAGNILLIPVV